MRPLQFVDLLQALLVLVLQGAVLAGLFSKLRLQLVYRRRVFLVLVLQSVALDRNSIQLFLRLAVVAVLLLDEQLDSLDELRKLGLLGFFLVLVQELDQLLADKLLIAVQLLVLLLHVG